jgi:elongation factor Ts
VAKDENFRAFADRVAGAVLDNRPASVEALMALTSDGRTLEEGRQDLIIKVGENITVRRFEVVESEGHVGGYVHGNRIGVLVDLEGGNAELARDLAMQVASLAPRYVAGDDVPKDVLDKEREIILAQTAEEKKPPEIIAKMVEGKLRKFVDEITLTGQVFVKDDKKRVRDLLAANKAKVKGFRRYEVGEGIEKKKDDFVQEVMAQAKQSR